MKLALLIIASITVVAVVLFYSTTEQSLNEPADMPWHITVHDANHSEVFGIELNKTTLEQARQKFGKLDGLALFKSQKGDYSLEAYFGKVNIGPFSARIIANLDASQSELDSLTEHTIKRVITEDGSQRWTIKTDKQSEQGVRLIKSLSYIPAYSGMDQQFITQRFGEPASRKVVDETTELWFYPQQGVRIMVDNDGKELFEYMTQTQFNLTAGEL
ncbi:MAG: hypothetical protein GY744_13225 [Gammaproteobacteria bacterium]|nr:hypothetical protein [Gammaproteobacteria bacterium]